MRQNFLVRPTSAACDLYGERRWELAEEGSYDGDG